MKKYTNLFFILLVIFSLTGCGQLRPELREIPDYDPAYFPVTLEETEHILPPFANKTTEDRGEGYASDTYEFNHELFSISITRHFITKIQEQGVISILVMINNTAPLKDPQFLPEFYRFFDPFMQAMPVTYDKKAVEKLFNPTEIVNGGNLAVIDLSETITVRTSLMGGVSERFSDAEKMIFSMTIAYDDNFYN